MSQRTTTCLSEEEKWRTVLENENAKVLGEGLSNFSETSRMMGHNYSMAPLEPFFNSCTESCEEPLVVMYGKGKERCQ